MPLIVTPRQLAQRSELYHQIASLITAGIPLIQAFETIRRSPPSRSMKRPLTELIEALTHNATFSEALQAVGKRWPAFDLALLKAGEQSGRLDVCFRLLAGYYEERARLSRSVISDLLYPAVVVHIALLVFPPALLRQLVWDGSAVPFLTQKLSVFLPLYGVIFIGLYACQGRHGEWWRSQIERFSRAIPVLGTARRNLALARLSASLEGLLNAGVPIIDAWELAAASSGSPALHRTVRSWRPRIEAGETPSEAVADSPAFPELFASLYATGEMSGTLDETLRRLYAHYQEEGSRKLRAAAQWAPRFLYFGLLILIGYYVVNFWIGYYSGIVEAFD